MVLAVILVTEIRERSPLCRAFRPPLTPGAYDALSARLVERAGFSAYVLGGISIAASRYGLPDLGLIGLAEMSAAVQDCTRACGLSVLVDGDTGYGDVINVVHTVETYESMGVSALLLEDQLAPKRYGHLKGKDVIGAVEMEAKIAAAVAARNKKEFFIIARTDARAVHRLDDALKRAERYLRAGADGLFIEAPESLDELQRVAQEFDVPQVCNMLVGGITPVLSNADLFDMGFSMIVHGTTLLMGVAAQATSILEAIRLDRLDSTKGFMTTKQYQEVLNVERWTNTQMGAARDSRSGEAAAG
jgi:2-methylisocitrate lyase-like PEP mutase family enzyme